MTEADFALLRSFLKQRSGLDLGPEKRYLAESRLTPLYRALGCPTLSDLVRRLRLPGGEAAAQAVVDAMATNETLFFRDRVPFDGLRDTILPRLIASRAGSRRLKIWSAACSTGQEPYSIAMILADMAAALRGWRVEILATDVSTSAIARAKAGLFSQFEVQRGLPIRALLRHFTQTEEGWRISADLRRQVDFRLHNMLEDLPRRPTFDIILCRNLLIYLDLPTKIRTVARLAGHLAEDGALCLGAAETAHALTPDLIPDPQARGFLIRSGAAQGPARLRAAG